MQAFQTTVTNFDAAQGGIFEARFDNELLGNTSTLGAEVAAMVKGLQTGNAALVAAAAEEMHANAADVGGNNLPTTGGTYNPDGLTVADVLSTPVAATAPVAPAAQGAAPTPQNAASAARADAHGHNRRCRGDGAGRSDRGGGAPFSRRRNGAPLSSHVGMRPREGMASSVRCIHGRWSRSDSPARQRSCLNRHHVAGEFPHKERTFRSSISAKRDLGARICLTARTVFGGILHGAKSVTVQPDAARSRAIGEDRSKLTHRIDGSACGIPGCGVRA